MTATLAPRRISRFADELRAMLDTAGIPSASTATAPVLLTAHIMAGQDPDLWLQYEYEPGSYATVLLLTDARNAEHLTAEWVLTRALATARGNARDPRYTDEARRAASEMADALADMLAARLIPTRIVGVCSECVDYADTAAALYRHGDQLRHLGNDSNRCPGQGDDGTDDRARHQSIRTYLRDGRPGLVADIIAEVTR